MMTIIIIELFSFLFWIRSVYGGSSLAGARLLMEDSRIYSEYKFVLDNSDFSEYPDVTVYITGYCKEQTRHGEKITENGAFNECVYNYFVFKVYSGENYLGGTRKFDAIANVESCNEVYGRYSLPVDQTDLRAGLNKIHFTVTKSGGKDCAPAPAPDATVPPPPDATVPPPPDATVPAPDATVPPPPDATVPPPDATVPPPDATVPPPPPVPTSARARLLMEETGEYSEYKFVLDDSDFSEYPDVMVKITGICKNRRDGFTVNSEFNECVYWSFIFKVYSGKNYLGGTRKFDAIANVESCNEAYGPYSLPVYQTDLPSGTNKIHFTVTKSGGEDC